MSDAQKVRDFTEGASGKRCPDKPVRMDTSAVVFIIRMVISELDELACTVTSNDEEKDKLLSDAMTTRDLCHKYKDSYTSEADLIGAQFDALVDAWYYSLNTSAKHGVNMSKIFDLVHGANMAKRDPATGKFIRRESDGKVVKPAGWTSPDITREIERQADEGTWV